MTRHPIPNETSSTGGTATAEAQVASLAARLVGLHGEHGLGHDTKPPINHSATSRPARRRRGWLWWLCHTTFWFAALLLATVAALRIGFHDGNHFLTWLNAFTRYVYLPAYVCLAWSLWQRRWFLTIVSGMVVGCHVAWLAPDFIRDYRHDSVVDVVTQTSNASPTARIFFANVRANNRNYAELLDEISAANPDVIVLVEFGPSWYRAIKDSPILSPYIYGSGLMHSHVGTVNVVSKLPVTTEMQNWVSGRAIHTADIQLGSQTLRIVGLHGPRPMNYPGYDYKGYWKQMIPLLTSEPGPLVVVGDFNATQYSLIYKELTADRLRSAHADQGRGYATTWPNGHYLLPPIRIDQALVSPEIECLGLAEGRGIGSDHKPLILDLRIRSSSHDSPSVAPAP